MRTAFGRYIKKIKHEIMEKPISCGRASMWVAAVAAAHLAVLRHFLYSLCPVVLLTGFPCPACGMTRAGVLALTGHFEEAWNMQPFIYVLGVFLVAAGIWRYLLFKDSVKWIKGCLAVIMIGMIAFYFYRMARYFPNTPPMTYYRGNLLQMLRAIVF
jgi:hypothetical protein